MLYVEFFVRKVKQRAEKGPEQTWTRVKKSALLVVDGLRHIPRGGAARVAAVSLAVDAILLHGESTVGAASLATFSSADMGAGLCAHTVLHGRERPRSAELSRDSTQR